MSSWIEFHAARIKRLQKFSDFRKDLQMSANEALGLLGSFWCEVIELAESGEISGWTPEYLCERVGSTLSPERVWTALVKHRWVDERADGKKTVHDWLDCAGSFLRGKYATNNRQRLVEIWALYGRVYGEKAKSDKPPIENQLEANKKPTLPKGLGKVKVSSSSHSDGGIGGKGDPWFSDPAFSRAWDGWEEMRKAAGAKPTDHARELNLAKLHRLSGEDLAKAIEIINESTQNNWKGFFPLKGNEHVNGTGASRKDHGKNLREFPEALAL